jgi:Family of unknown function (DUF6295)
VCTYQTERLSGEGSAKTPSGWTSVTSASVYVDHPVHYGASHAVLIDVMNLEKGPAARVALELSAASARELAEAILCGLASAPSDLLEDVTP